MKTEREVLEVLPVKENNCIKFSLTGKSPGLFLEFFAEHQHRITTVEVIETGWDQEEHFIIMEIHCVNDPNDEEYLLAQCHNYILENL